MASDLEKLIENMEKQEKKAEDFKAQNNDEMFFSSTYMLLDLYSQFSKNYNPEKDVLNNKHKEILSKIENSIKNFIQEYSSYQGNWVLIVDGKIELYDKNLANILDKESEYVKMNM
ncbi:MAG: hypothetical protein ACP5OZ_03605 [Candidatus Woesearchaeota archaeon]